MMTLRSKQDFDIVPTLLTGVEDRLPAAQAWAEKRNENVQSLRSLIINTERERLDAIERERQADARRQADAARRAALLTKLDFVRYAQLRPRIMDLFIEAHLTKDDVVKGVITTNLPLYLDALTTPIIRLDPLDFKAHERQWIAEDYERGLLPDFHEMTPATRAIFLPFWLGLNAGHSFPALDLDASVGGTQLVYVARGGAIAWDKWADRIDDISDYLRMPLELERIPGGTSFRLTKKAVLPQLPAAIDFDSDDVRAGEIFLGTDVHDHSRVSLNLAGMTSTFVVGPAGTGKTNALHVIIRSLVSNLDDIDHVYLIDGKNYAFNRYKQVAPGKIDVRKRDDIYRTVDEINAIMLDRLAEFEALDTEDAPPQQPYIVLIIDEMSIFSSPLPGIEKKQHDAFIQTLSQLAQIGREPGIRIFVTAQDPTSRAVPVPVLNNLSTFIAFRLRFPAHINAVYGEWADMKPKPSDLPKGQAYVRDGHTQTERLVQFHNLNLGGRG